MRVPKLRTLPLIQSLANSQIATEKTMQYAGLPRGTVRATVVSVDDPKSRGRVKVVFDEMNPDIPQVTGAGDYSKRRVGGEPDKSHWLDTSPAFRGKQPPGLVGKRVNVAVSNGQYQYAILQDVLFDPQVLATDAKKKPKMPNNSSMTRLPCYPNDQMPPPTAENVGCLVVALNSYDNVDWVCCCLKREGGYAWVALMDRLHIHDSQQNDSRGDREFTVYDNTHATTPAGAGPDQEPVVAP